MAEKPVNAEAASIEAAMGGEGETLPAVVQPSFGLAKPGEAQTFTGPITPPYLSIAYGVGGLSEAGYNPGALVLDKKHLIAEKMEPVRMIIINYKEYWKEYISPARWSAGDRPKSFMSEAEAHNAGFTTQYDPVTGSLPTAPGALALTLLIEKPEKLVCQLFCIEANGKLYAPAIMPVEKSGYTAIRNDFGMAVRHTTKLRGIYSVIWEMKTISRKAKSTGNSTWVPNIRIVQTMTDAEVENVTQAVANG